MSDQELCKRCRNIPLDLFLGENKTYELARTLAELEESAKYCVACEFWESGGGFGLFFLDITRHLEGFSITLSSFDGLKLQVAGQWRGSGESMSVSRPLYCWAEPKNGNGKGSGNVDYRYYTSSSLSEKSADLMRALIDECTNTHTHALCQGLESFPDVPSRLLFVGVDASPQLRLVTTSDLSEVPAYVALSHCWGNVAEDAPWKLKKNNMAGFHDEVPEDLLPRTFLDAVEITRSLGESYIWIDSICILQDCAKDWDIESKKMAGIYNNALCTLGSASDSAQGGCVGLRSRRALFTLRLPTGAVTFYQPVESEGEEDIPITKRAWCLQERELAKRFIQFTDQGFLWFCAHHRVSEYNFLGSLSSSDAKAPILSFFKKNSLVYSIGVPTFPVGDDAVSNRHTLGILVLSKKNLFHDYWYNLVTEYTKREITKPSDRLPAIAGLAERVSKKLPEDLYVSGLWLSDMRNGLLWKLDRNVEGDRESTSPIAPSWSWAAPNKQIEFEYQWVDKLGSYGEHRAPTFAIPSDVDRKVPPFPLLQAQGSLMLVKCSREDYPESYHLENCDRRINHGKPPRNRRRDQEDISARYLRAWWQWSMDMRSGCYDGIFHCLIFATDHYDDCRKGPRGLILKCVDPEKRLYKRMGVFDNHNCDDWLDETLWEELIALKRETFYIM